MVDELQIELTRSSIAELGDRGLLIRGCWKDNILGEFLVDHEKLVQVAQIVDDLEIMIKLETVSQVPKAGNVPSLSSLLIDDELQKLLVGPKSDGTSDTRTHVFANPSADTCSDALTVAKWMGHDQVQSYKQPEPVTISEKAAVKFKPQLHITNGCHPYPAVSWWGETSDGLKPTGAPSSNCKGSGWGSQVYGRSTWYRGMWAIMYSWYFPKDSPSTGLGHRHDWEHVIAWINAWLVGWITFGTLTLVPSRHR
ncbi:Necrosis inducing-like protein NPP1 type [Phytophthora cinnamomi]|uniref:Necrosis inducing-like protein NPP1 type n=1 Tax=Phytophthora cinnamomi TaxID=4785 RepID=UPI003559EFBA|nr:Necrosis inducing-like protein NPP1 type [Phytophthora cinnamomi]